MAKKKTTTGEEKKQRTTLDLVLRFIFGLQMGIGMAVAALLIKIVEVVPFMSKNAKEGLSLQIVKATWSTALFFAQPWVRQEAADDFQETTDVFNQCVAAFEETGRPVFILGNHTSFLDTILTVSKLPMYVIGRTRTYMSSHLFNLPILSTICKGCGHFPVHFTSSELGKFSVDREKMKIVGADVDAHINKNGLLCFFPEGQMNSEPSKILPLRYGGMKKALEFDACLFSFVTCGNPDIWPRRAQMGGFPGTARYSFRALAPDGVKDLLKNIRDAKDGEGFESGKDDPDHVLLANFCQIVMQAQHDSMLPSSKDKDE